MNSSKLPLADKKFGQHFLINPNVIKKITTAPACDFDLTLEIGPGPGVLTKHLPKPLAVIEKDKRFNEKLLELVEKDHLYLADALEFDFSIFQHHKIWLVSNLPYNISAPLTIRLIQLDSIKCMHLMYQKEVARKILEIDTHMNSLAALCHNYYEISSLVKVSPGSFYPPPKVQSEVLRFVRKERPSILDFKSYEKFLRAIFKEKRKTILNNLKSSYSTISKTDLEQLLKRCFLDPKIRPQHLSRSQVESIYHEINHLL